MFQIPEEFIYCAQTHRKKVLEFQNSKMELAEFKKYCSSMGIYEERGTNTYMVRVRVPAAEVTPDQLSVIANLADLYAKGYIHFTTRQSVQFHSLNLINTADVLEKLLEVGITGKGTGGNCVRNVACSPLSGVSKDEIFDVTEYVIKTMNHLLNDSSAFTLPRKFKISFSNSPADTANATISDLGFIAKIKDGIKGFEVYGGGGLGKNPAVAIKLEEFIPTNEFLYHIFAMKELFNAEGDRENRNKARIRYILFRLGEDEFKNKYKYYLEEIKAKYNFNGLEEKEISASNNLISETGNNLLVKQKNGDFYSVYVHPENGYINTKNLTKIIEFLENLEDDISIRLTNTQGFFVRNLKPASAEKLLEIISKFTSTFDLDNSVSCVGASICGLGICRSQQLLRAIKEKFKNQDTAIKSQLPKIYISGCPNSCGQHQIGEIGFSGRARKFEDGLVPMYNIYFGGSVKSGGAVFGTNYGEIPARKIPDFLSELAKLKHKSNCTNFSEFVKIEEKGIKEMIEKYGRIESKLQNPSLYYDFEC